MSPTTSRVGDGSSEMPHLPIPVSSLRWIRTPSGMRPSAVDELEPGDAGLADLPLRHRPEHDDARVPERGAKVERFRQRRDAERSGTRLEGRLRHVDRTVPVALRLHHGPQLGALGGPEQRRGVAPNRSEVEGEARPLHVAILY